LADGANADKLIRDLGRRLAGQRQKPMQVRA
jgi:hypothetical protein